MDPKLGLELELILIDQEGVVQNAASEVLEHRENFGFVIREASQCIVETIAPPSSDLYAIANYFSTSLTILRSITRNLGLLTLPSTAIGIADIESFDYMNPRGQQRREILGNDIRKLELQLCGSHVTVDKLEGDEKQYKQLLCMYAMDPAFAFMSSTPFFMGNNSKKDYRVDVYRNIVFKDHPLQGQLLDYPASLAHAAGRQAMAYFDWNDRLRIGESLKGITQDNCFWGPVKIKPNAFEARGSDTNLLSNLIAHAALYQGIARFINHMNPEVVIDENDDMAAYELFLPKAGKIFLPSFKRLKQFEDIGIYEGLSNEELNGYLRNVYRTAQPYTDWQLLMPLNMQLFHGRSLSDDINDHAKSLGFDDTKSLTDEQARNVALHVAELYRKDLHRYGPDISKWGRHHTEGIWFLND